MARTIRDDIDLERVLFVSLTIAGAVVLLVIAVTARNGADFDAYRSIDLGNIYVPTTEMSTRYAFRYSPPIAILMAPLAAVPFAPALWFAGQLAALWYVGRRWALALVLFPPVGLDLVYGNVNLFIAAAIVAGFRRPGVWAFPVLTKVTPGVGIAWFAVRREWRALATALGIIAAALRGGRSRRARVDSRMAGGPRLQCRGNAVRGNCHPPLVPIDSGARRGHPGCPANRRWTVPVAVTLAMPVWWPISFVPADRCPTARA